MSLENFPNFFLNLSERDVNGEKRQFYEFKSFRLDVAERQLLNEGSPVQLTPKAFDVLTTLVENSGHLLTKEELLEKVWADSFVEEINVSRLVHTLRKTLGEDENGNKFIETVPKKGYRFVADVVEVSEPAAVASGLLDNRQPAAADASQRGAVEELSTILPTADKPKPNPRFILFAVGFLSAVFLIILLSFNYRSDSASDFQKIKSIAVLPLKPIDSANRDEVYEIGIADSLINRLGTMKGIIVRPLGATRQYDGVAQNPLAAGKEQQADYVLSANYQNADGKIRVTAQLFNVESGKIEETYKTEKDAGNIFALQDQIAGEIGNLLLNRFALTPNTTTMSQRGTNNEEAYRLYLQGRNLTIRRNNEAHKKAIEYFEQAIRLDPNYALAYARMAHAYYSSILPENSSANAEKAKELVNKALELDPNAAEAYVSRGYITMLYDWDLSAAERDFLRAIELEPNNDGAHWLYGLILTYRQRFDEGLTEIETAISIDPGATVYMTHRGRILYYARRYDEAIAQFKQSADLDDRAAMPYAWLVRLYETKGDYVSAYQSFLEREERSPRKDQVTIFQKAYETAGWRGLKDKETEFAANRFFDRASLHALQGEKDAAFENLNKAAENRDWRIITLTVEPSFDSLRDDPRFGALLVQTGIQ